MTVLIPVVDPCRHREREEEREVETHKVRERELEKESEACETVRDCVQYVVVAVVNS